jgi:hypothetical protein
MKKQRIIDMNDDARVVVYYDIMLKICNNKRKKILTTIFEKMKDIETNFKINFVEIKAILNEILLETKSIEITPMQLLAILENEDLIKDGKKLIEDLKRKAIEIIKNK